MELNFELLKTEALDNHIHRGQTVDIGAPQLYGGLVMGQAVYAASQTVPRDRMIHSMHCCFYSPWRSLCPNYLPDRSNSRRK